ncbi:MAG TPA: MarR family transcriptional regulator [Caldilineaceae bacterium]|nr:MarR family transcriptional regulator [Caldilineaceae bacterium]
MQAHEVHDSSARLAVWQAYLRTHATIISLLERYLLQEQELPLLWYDTLDRLSQAGPYGLRLQELAEAINLSQSGLTRLLDRMVEADLVVRRPCTQDRRGLYAAITPAGSERLAAARPVYQRVLDEHFLRYLSRDEVVALNKVFTHIVAMESAASAAER